MNTNPIRNFLSLEQIVQQYGINLGRKDPNDQSPIQTYMEESTVDPSIFPPELVLEGNNLNIQGSQNRDTFEVRGNGNTVQTGEGNDSIGIKGSGNVITGGNGNDYIYARGNSNISYGEDGDDSLHSNGSYNYLYGQTGNDYLQAIDLDDLHSHLEGGDGDDHVSSIGDNQNAQGGAGNDRIYSSGKNSYAIGGDGDDTMQVSGTGSISAAGAGDDTTELRNRDTTYDVGSGNDTAIQSGIVDNSPYPINGSTGFPNRQAEQYNDGYKDTLKITNGSVTDAEKKVTSPNGKSLLAGPPKVKEQRQMSSEEAGQKLASFNVQSDGRRLGQNDVQLGEYKPSENPKPKNKLLEFLNRSLNQPKTQTKEDKPKPPNPTQAKEEPKSLPPGDKAK
jgi:Ca2+-binding RTX toxin-like protein